MTEADTSSSGEPSPPTPKPAPSVRPSDTARPGPRKRAGEPSPVPEAPLIDRRMAFALGLLILISLVANNLFNRQVDKLFDPQPDKPREAWEIGGEADVQITLITADRGRLECAHGEQFEGLHCAYDQDKRRIRRQPGAPLDDDRLSIIQPYRTADTNSLILVAGLWAQPELAYRVHLEPPTLYPAKKQLRFVAYCHVAFVAKLDEVALRWDTGAKWQTSKNAMVARAERCTLDEPTPEPVMAPRPER